MTSSRPKVPLWPRTGRSGRSAPAVASVSSSIGPGSAATAVLRLDRPEPIEPGQDPPLAVVQAGFDVGWKDVAPDGSNAEGDRHGILGLVADRDRDPAYSELFRPLGGAAVEADRRLA